MMTCLLASDLADVDAEAEPEAVAPAGAPVLIVEDRVSLWLGPNSTKSNTKIVKTYVPDALTFKVSEALGKFVKTLAALEDTEERMEAKEEAAAVFMEVVVLSLAVPKSEEEPSVVGEGFAIAAAANKVTRAIENFIFERGKREEN